MSVALNAGSVVATAGQTINVASLLRFTPEANPTYLIVSLLDRKEYTASSNGNTGSLSDNGHTTGFGYLSGDSNTVGIVFTFNASTGQFINATYGSLANLVYTASTNTNDNTSLSVFTTNNPASPANYANNPLRPRKLRRDQYLVRWQHLSRNPTHVRRTDAEPGNPQLYLQRRHEFCGYGLQ